MDEWIYLDNNATTQLAPEVRDAILQEMHSFPSNPSSIHHFGQMAKARLANARHLIAQFLKVKPAEILFTSGGTESMNMLIRRFPKGRIITSDIEHSCVFKTCQYLESIGYDVVYLKAHEKGYIDPEDVKKNITTSDTLIVLSAVNSETGVKNKVREIAKIAKESSAYFIVDAVALLGKEPFEIIDGISAMGFSSHKFHGPTGSGFVYLSKKCKISPFHLGGEQEYQLRAGTENLLGIIGMAKAVELLQNNVEEFSAKMANLRDLFESLLMKNIQGVRVNGTGKRIPNTSNLSFEKINGESLLISLDLEKVAASHGSACSSGAIEPSRVLLNMGLDPERAKSSIRFSLSRYTTKEEIETAASIIQKTVQQLKNIK
ncbi:MAG: cysteine desulfurase [Chlamydiae bacterium CG10_big_fil_rev_8_21_14_0_10_35_9]|nr:MAG: cysteine desulfurase [Chlamydiae bacterium CG10_big_fil_rev_8_21_14_0_10_35_9]